MTGYRMYYHAVGDQGNIDINANETKYVLLGLQYGLSYTITMLTKSQHLPSRLSSSVRVTLGKALQCSCIKFYSFSEFFLTCLQLW